MKTRGSKQRTLSPSPSPSMVRVRMIVGFLSSSLSRLSIFLHRTFSSLSNLVSYRAISLVGTIIFLLSTLIAGAILLSFVSLACAGTQACEPTSVIELAYGWFLDVMYGFFGFIIVVSSVLYQIFDAIGLPGFDGWDVMREQGFTDLDLLFESLRLLLEGGPD